MTAVQRSVPVRVAAAALAAGCAAAGCAAAGAPAVVHAHAARQPAVVRPAAADGHVAAALTSPVPRRSRGPRPVTWMPRPATRSGRSARKARAAPRQARPADLASARAKKGVSTWTFNGAGAALAESGASWFYTWSSGHGGISTPLGVKFVPMIWGPGSVNAATLSQARHHGHVLLGFNEPDMTGQADMSVGQALHLWPALMATGMRLGSPAVATGAATPGGWLDRFMRGAAARGYRVSFIAVHWYGGDFATRAAVGQLRSYLRQIHARYHKPIWLTEFALANFGTPASFPSQRQQAAFVSASAAMLDRLSYVQRFAWFALPASATGGTGLFRAGPVATRVGRAFEAAP